MNRKVAGSLAGIVIVTALGTAARGVFRRGDGERRDSRERGPLTPPMSSTQSEDAPSSGAVAWARAAFGAAAGRFRRGPDTDLDLLRQMRGAVAGAVTHPAMIGILLRNA